MRSRSKARVKGYCYQDPRLDFPSPATPPVPSPDYSSEGIGKARHRQGVKVRPLFEEG